MQTGGCVFFLFLLLVFVGSIGYGIDDCRERLKLGDEGCGGCSGA